MHRKIDAAVDQRLVDLLGEQPFAADLGKPPVLHPIAGRADRDDFHHLGRRELGMRGRQAFAHQLGWRSAIGLPRVPMRSARGVGMWLVSFNPGPLRSKPTRRQYFVWN